MAELARGTVFDRPWGRTLGALGLRGLTGQLTLSPGDGKIYEIAFSNGAVVGASSPVASDSAVRVALTGGLVSTTQVAELARKQAASPTRDEVDVISEHLKLGFDQAMRLRRRTIAQRAARSFSVDRGEFVVTDAITLHAVAGSELDIRSVIYIGAKQNLSEARLAAELGLFGTWFRLKPEAFEDLPQFGFSDVERPIVDQLLNGASLGDLEAIVGVDVRSVRATLYALCAANACNVEQTRGQGSTRPPQMKGSDPAMKRPSGSQPPATQPTAPPEKPATQPPRTNRPTQQPLVAYRPGRRSPSQQPPSTTSTPRTTAAPPTQARTTTAPPPAQARATTVPPSVARATTTTPPTPTPVSPRTRSATPHPALDTPRANPVMRPTRAATEPGIEPGVPRQARASTDPGMAARQARASTDPDSRTASPRVPAPAAPALPRTTSPSASRAGMSRVLTPPSGRGQHVSLPIPTKKALTLPEVQQLITSRAGIMDSGATYYGLLGVDATATSDQIRKAYFDLARQLHPDRLQSLGIDDTSHVAHRVFAQLNTAFSVLSDAKRRSEYDGVLGRGGEAALLDEQNRAEEIAMRILRAEEAYKRGEMALKRDDLGNAIAELERACELHPDEPDFYALHAWAVFCASPDKNAVSRQTRATLEKAIQRSPKAINPRFYLGRVERMLGRDQQALALFKEVLVDKPHHFEAQSEVRAIESRLQGPAPKGGGLFRKR